MSKTLEDLGYEKDIDSEDEFLTRYIKDNDCISFWHTKKQVNCYNRFEPFKYLTMEELKAIYQYCIDNKWI